MADNISNQIYTFIEQVREKLLGLAEFEELLIDLEAIPNQMQQPMQLAIIGKISSSKSTLVNAILGEAEIVRTGAMEETFNVSWLFRV